MKIKNFSIKDTFYYTIKALIILTLLPIVIIAGGAIFGGGYDW